jgi:hypothetical protein
VWGVTQCDNKLFVVCAGSDRISVFGPNNEHLWSISINGLSAPCDIVSCTETRLLHIADIKCVWRVSLDGDVICRLPNKRLPNKSSTTTFRPRSLSVMSRRLLVTSHDELLLFGADGVELKRVSSHNMNGLYHAVETSRGTFVVGYSQPMPHISEVDDSGHEIRSYLGKLELGCPEYLALDSDGRVFVADRKQNHVLLLNSRLKLERVLLDAEQHGLAKDPSRIHYDEQSGVLSVVGLWSKAAQQFVVRNHYRPRPNVANGVTKPTVLEYLTMRKVPGGFKDSRWHSKMAQTGTFQSRNPFSAGATPHILSKTSVVVYPSFVPSSQVRSRKRSPDITSIKKCRSSTQ